MPSFCSLETVEKQFFHVEWETTLKCNLDCSYCGDGHDNNTTHPSLEDSLKTVDFIIDYVSIQMASRPAGTRNALLNIFGGESLFHPDIIEILEYIERKRRSVEWKLDISVITNAVIGNKLWTAMSEIIDSFTVSFHPESLIKQRNMVKQNILALKNKRKYFSVSIMMHPKYWDVCMEMIAWCKTNDIPYKERQIDHHWGDWRFNYTKEQAMYLTGEQPITFFGKAKAILTNGIDLSSTGRACCGQSQLCVDGTETLTYIKGNNFKNWYCSVDKFFLYIRQNTGEVFTNKDCKMNHQGHVGPIGNLNNTDEILKNLRKGTPTIVCKKSTCWCGLCAPKAKDRSQFENIMKIYQI